MATTIKDDMNEKFYLPLLLMVLLTGCASPKPKYKVGDWVRHRVDYSAHVITHRVCTENTPECMYAIQGSDGEYWVSEFWLQACDECVDGKGYGQ